MEPFILDHTQMKLLLAALLPMPKDDEINYQMSLDRQANPHNDSNKPRQRNVAQIMAELQMKKVIALYDVVIVQERKDR